MANEIRVRQNFLGGLIEDNPLLIGATTLTSSALAAMPVIGTTQHMPIVFDPDGLYGEPEIVYITAHTVGATTATILRGQEGSTARQHQQDMPWLHGPTIYDVAPRVIGVDLAAGTTTQTVATATWTSINFPDAENYDTHNLHDPASNNTRITIPTGLDGKWLLTGCVSFESNATGMRFARLLKNATTGIANNVADNATASYRTRVETARPVVLAAGDYVELQGYQTSGGGLIVSPTTANGDAGETWFTATYLGI